MTAERSKILITPAQMTQKIGLIQSCERISRQDFEDFRGAERGAERGGRVNATLVTNYRRPPPAPPANRRLRPCACVIVGKTGWRLGANFIVER